MNSTLEIEPHIWVQPKLLAEIEYRAKSAEGKVRHPFIRGAAGGFVMKEKGPFDLWLEWAQKPHESFLMIDADIYCPDHGAFAGRSAKSREGQRSCASVPRTSEVQYLNRIGRRIIMCAMIAALAIIWNAFGH